jgi:hypothetical protein
MNKAHVEYLKSQYNSVVGDYCQMFCLKHGWLYDPKNWVGNRVGEVLNINEEMFVDFNDIKADIDNDFKIEDFEDWYNYTQELFALGCTKQINYYAFAKGAPLPYSKEQLDLIRKSKEQVKKAEEELQDCMAAVAEGSTFMKGDCVCGNCRYSISQTDGNYHRCTLHNTFHKFFDNSCRDWQKGGSNEPA